MSLGKKGCTLASPCTECVMGIRVRDKLHTEGSEFVQHLYDCECGKCVYVPSLRGKFAEVAREKSPKELAAERQRDELLELLKKVEDEVVTAMTNWPPFNSAHEGLAVLMEEFDELKAHVWTNQKRRDLVAMKKEAIQVAAMATRFALEVCSEDRGRK